MSLSLGAEFTSEFTFAVLHCSGFDKCVETQILHYGITALEILYVLLIHPSFLMSPQQPLICWLILCLFPECYIIRVLCNLFSLVSPLSNVFKFPLCSSNFEKVLCVPLIPRPGLWPAYGLLAFVFSPTHVTVAAPAWLWELFSLLPCCCAEDLPSSLWGPGTCMCIFSAPPHYVLQTHRGLFIDIAVLS